MSTARGGWAAETYQFEVEVELTHKQREAVEAALELGWWAGPPREARIGDIAAALGITAGPASRRIRGAEAEVMREVAEKIAARPRCPLCGDEVQYLPDHLPGCRARHEVAAR